MAVQQFHTVSIEDREMFAYNKRRSELDHHLAQPENRIKYAYQFLSDFKDDKQAYNHSLKLALDWISLAEGEGSDY